MGSQVANCNTKLNITVSLKRTDSADPYIHWNSGVFFKTTTDFSSKVISGYWAAYNKCRTDANGRCTGNAADPVGLAVLWRLDGVNLATNTGNGSLLCSAQAPVVEGGVNAIKIVSDGSSHSFSVNGKSVCTVNDATYSTGGVMLGAAMGSSGNQSISFNSVSLQSIGSGSAIASSQAYRVMNPATLAPPSIAANASVAGSRSP